MKCGSIMGHSSLIGIHIPIRELFANVIPELQYYKLYVIGVFNRQLDWRVTRVRAVCAHAHACVTYSASAQHPLIDYELTNTV